MVAYDYDLLKIPEKFVSKLTTCLSSLVEVMKREEGVTNQLVDFLLRLLVIDPKKR